MDNKAKNFFSKPRNGNLLPAVLAFGGMAAGFGYLVWQKEKAKQRKPEIVEPKLKKIKEPEIEEITESYLDKKE